MCFFAEGTKLKEFIKGIKDNFCSTVFVNSFPYIHSIFEHLYPNTKSDNILVVFETFTQMILLNNFQASQLFSK